MGPSTLNSDDVQGRYRLTRNLLLPENERSAAFSVNESAHLPDSVNYYGINRGNLGSGMRERASALGGTLVIESITGGYTELSVELPPTGHLERRAVERET